MKDPAFIQNMIQKGKLAGERVLAEFDHLNNRQLNWKPSAEQWSIAQCLDHLVVSNNTYFPVLEKIASGSHKMNWWERNSPLSGVFGKMLVNQLKETVKRKMRAPQLFRPAASEINTDIILSFNTQLDKFLKLMNECLDADLDKTIITSPVSRIITYNLKDAYTILVQHLHRHINQAIRVKNNPSFPH